MGLGIASYDFLAKDGETLTEAAARYRQRRPLLTRWAISTVARHLSGELAPWADPLAVAFVVVRRMRHRPVVVVSDVKGGR